MKPRVYIETTVVSYLTAWRSPQLVMAAHQEATRSWWDESREHFDVFVSEAVVQEASADDPDAAGRRLEVVEKLPSLDITDEARDLARALLAGTSMPGNAQIDALHIAIATVNAMDYLLTWNCRHIANAAIRHEVESICRRADYQPPIIGTPLELREA